MTAPIELKPGDWVCFSKTAPDLVNQIGEPDIGQTGEYCGIMYHHENGDHAILFKWKNDDPYDTLIYDHCCLRSQLRKLPGRAK